MSENEHPITAPGPAHALEDRIAAIITRALLEGCDNHKTRAQIARETARQVMEVAQKNCDDANGYPERVWIHRGDPRFPEDDVWTDDHTNPFEGPAYIRADLTDSSTSYEDGVKEGLRRAAALVREKHIVHGAGADLLEPRWEGNRSGLAYADAIEALSLLPKEEGR